MGIELQSETRILIGRLCAPADPERAWWWQSSTTVEGAELIVAGYATTENEAILEAAASTIDLHAQIGSRPVAPKPADPDPRHEPGWWPGLEKPG